jgi:hypothetical protein
VARSELLDHVSNLMTVERHQRNRAVMRTCAPGGPEFRPGCDENEEGSQRAAFGDAAHDIDRGRIGPMHIFKCEVSLALVVRSPNAAFLISGWVCEANFGERVSITLGGYATD